MDWQQAISRNREGLAGVVAGLVPLAEAAREVPHPKPLCRFIARILRPAEAALRRLVVVVVALFQQTASPLRGGTRGKRSAADWVGVTRKFDEDNSHQGAVENSGYSDPHPEQLRFTRFSDLPSRGRLVGTRSLPDFSGFARRGTFAAFPLIDPRKRFGETGKLAGFGRVLPRISVPGIFDPAPVAEPDNALGIATLHRRIRRFQYALANLPKQARRLNRLMARHACAKPGPGRVGPIRPGHPPGHRKRSPHEVHAILGECQFLALECGLKPP